MPWADGVHACAEHSAVAASASISTPSIGLSDHGCCNKVLVIGSFVVRPKGKLLQNVLSSMQSFIKLQRVKLDKKRLLACQM